MPDKKTLILTICRYFQVNAIDFMLNQLPIVVHLKLLWELLWSVGVTFFGVLVESLKAL